MTKTIKSIMTDMVKSQMEINMEKVDLVKQRIRRKTKIWLSFILFGWSYGSLGNLGAQILWYVVPGLAFYGIYENYLTKEFTVFTSLSMVFIPIWIIWGIFRIVTLNKAIDKYNEELADFFGLTSEEKALLQI